MTPSEAREKIKIFQQTREDAIWEEIAEQYGRMVHKGASKYHNSHFKDDLIQIGMEAMWDAVLNYNRWDLNPSTYIFNCIQGKMKVEAGKQTGYSWYYDKKVGLPKPVFLSVKECFTESSDNKAIKVPKRWMSHQNLDFLEMDDLLKGFTEFDKNILQKLVEGYTMVEIAKQMGEKKQTVYYYIRNIKIRLKEKMNAKVD